MSDEVDICNYALIKIGANTISSLTENSPAARRCSVVYSQQRDYLLRGHFWNFATKRVQLAELSAAPEFEWENQFQLPTDFLRVIQIYNDPNAPYKIEGDRILTNLSTLQLVYVYKVTDPNKFDPSFVEALTGAVAKELAYAMAASSQLAERAARDAKEALRRAKTIDSQEGSPTNMTANTFVNAGRNPTPWDV